MLVADANATTPDETFGNGSNGAIGAATQTGKGGDGFCYFVFRAADVNIKSTVVVTGAVVSTFVLSGVSYTKIQFNTSGSMTVSDPIGNARHCLVGGGGSGGKTSGPGTRGGGAGAGRAIDSGLTTLLAGSYTINIGAGAPANTGGNTQGSNGSNSTITGAMALTAEGGGYGGGNTGGFNDGGAGGNGGGGTGSGVAPTVGGVGVQNNGGAGFFSASTDKAAGGGGGAGGVGQAGVANVGGNGGPGLTLSWADGLQVAGGGGGVGITMGTATHGGSDGGSTTDAVNGGGSGGRQAGSTGKGGDGLFVLVVPTSAINVVMA